MSKTFAALLMSLSLASCGLFPQPPTAETPIEVAGVAGATVEGLVDGVALAFSEGRITKDQAEAAYVKLLEAQAYLRLAEEAFRLSQPEAGQVYTKQARTLLDFIAGLLKEANANG